MSGGGADVGDGFAVDNGDLDRLEENTFGDTSGSGWLRESFFWHSGFLFGDGVQGLERTVQGLQCMRVLFLEEGELRLDAGIPEMHGEIGCVEEVLEVVE